MVVAFRVDLPGCFLFARAWYLPTETKVESGDVSKQKCNLCYLSVTVDTSARVGMCAISSRNGTVPSAPYPLITAFVNCSVWTLQLRLAFTGIACASP